jgi:cytosine/adenosine deaminase-related metal-dependent hydrolase
MVVPVDAPPLENGAVVVDGNSIVAVGKPGDLTWMDDGPVVDLGEVVLLPGLINAHCHLDYTMMRYAISPPKSFTAWVQRINALKRSLDSDDYLSAIERGFRELRRWGTTTVCNIEAFPELMPRMPEPPIRTWWFYEMIDIRHRITTDDVVAGALSFFHGRPDSLSRFGLSPHAPYTASRPLFDLANACAGTMTMLLTTHVAESAEESAMFRERAGPLFEFMESLGRPMADCGKGSSFGMLWKSGAINSHWLLAHMNDLTEDDFALLANMPKGSAPHIVHCPGSHGYFDHPPFEFKRLQGLGVNISIGTDSLASTNSLSLFDELRRLESNEPWLSPEELLRTVTVNPARALRRHGRLGRIGPGALADLIALPLKGGVGSIYEQIIAYRDPVPWMMIDGKHVLT